MNSPSALLTAEEFGEQRSDLPDGGRWTELVAGRVQHLSPPDDMHGNIVLNLSKVIATCTHEHDDCGYACFELGFVVARRPDTVRTPPISFFRSGPRFAESDRVLTETRPSLVVEIASSNDRRRDLPERVNGYLDWGVATVWVIDPHERQAHVFERDRAVRHYTDQQTLLGGAAIRGFSMPVADLFREPGWWRG